MIDEKQWWEKPTETRELIKQFLPAFTREAEFSDDRRAILFKPGNYEDCEFELGYYQQMVGMGAAATGVHFHRSDKRSGEDFCHSGPHVFDLYPTRPECSSRRCALDSFWRSAENFHADSVEWFVSQAAPLRRIRVDNLLKLANVGPAWASGGFLANAEVGSIDYGTQQQYFVRNTKMTNIVGGDPFNAVYSGCKGNPDEGNPKVSVETTPRIRVEKPFIVCGKDNNNYELHVPAPTKNATEGPNLDAVGNNQVRSFANVKVVNPTLTDNNQSRVDKTRELQDVLDAGHDLIIAPGIYYLTASLIVNKGGGTTDTYKNQVILGLGMATLVAPLDGSPCIKVEAHSEGIRIAALILQGSVISKYEGSTLLEFGTRGVNGDGTSDNPGAIFDIFTRVGKFSASSSRDVSVETMIVIYSSHVVGDNLWLWRADHDKDLLMGQNHEGKVDTALHVYGDNVTMYGLFGEHTLKDITIWEGEYGQTQFYQSELNYNIPRNDPEAAKASVGYRVGPNVQHHFGSGVGVYSCHMHGYEVDVPFGIQIPANRPDVLLKRPFTHQLGNTKGMKAVLKVGYQDEAPLGGSTTNNGTVRLYGKGDYGLGPPF